MLVSVFIALLVLGTGASYQAFVAKRSPVYTSLASLGLWMVIGYAATSLDVIADDGSVVTAATSEPAVSALAFGNALLSAIVLLAASTGKYEESTAEAPDPTEITP